MLPFWFNFHIMNRSTYRSISRRTLYLIAIIMYIYQFAVHFSNSCESLWTEFLRAFECPSTDCSYVSSHTKYENYVALMPPTTPKNKVCCLTFCIFIYIYIHVTCMGDVGCVDEYKLAKLVNGAAKPKRRGA